MLVSTFIGKAAKREYRMCSGAADIRSGGVILHGDEGVDIGQGVPDGAFQNLTSSGIAPVKLKKECWGWGVLFCLVLRCFTGLRTNIEFVPVFHLLSKSSYNSTVLTLFISLSYIFHLCIFTCCDTHIVCTSSK